MKALNCVKAEKIVYDVQVFPEICRFVKEWSFNLILS